MVGDTAQTIAVSSKLGRRAAILMTGVALGALYIWAEPGALGTLEANSAQAADGQAGCILKVGAAPLTVGGEEVRVQSNDLCNGIDPHLAPPPAVSLTAAEPPARLLRTSVGPELPDQAPAERFAGITPREKPAGTLEFAALGAPDTHREPASLRDELERDARTTGRETEGGGDDGDGGEHDGGHDGGEHDDGEHDGGEHDGGGDRDGGERGGHSGGGEGSH